MDETRAFYERIVTQRIPDKDAAILVCGGGELDRDVFAALGYRNVTISNVDSRLDDRHYAPFRWQFENAEQLSYAADAFDYVGIHAAIHHASSPHRVLLEMYRVARSGVLAFESRDSALMNLLEKYHLTQVYEHAAVYYNDCKYGGVNNTEIPNFVYRWTEREIEKTIQAYAPYYQHKFIYAYATAFPCTPALERKGIFKWLFLKLMRPFHWLLTRVFVKQQNLFSFFVQKSPADAELFPWLVFDEQRQIKFNKAWGDRKYKESLPSGLGRG